jgi:hypothetical protein
MGDQPGIFRCHERLKRLSDLGDQLEGRALCRGIKCRVTCLPGPADENARRVYHLHRRYGQGIVAVIKGDGPICRRPHR